MTPADVAKIRRTRPTTFQVPIDKLRQDIAEARIKLDEEARYLISRHYRAKSFADENPRFEERLAVFIEEMLNESWRLRGIKFHLELLQHLAETLDAITIDLAIEDALELRQALTLPVRQERPLATRRGAWMVPGHAKPSARAQAPAGDISVATSDLLGAIGASFSSYRVPELPGSPTRPKRSNHQ